MPNRFVHAGARHSLRLAALLLGLAAGAALAVGGLALAKSFTLKVAKNVHVTNTPTKAFRVKAVDVHEAVAVGPSGFAVYTFQGETTHHIICQKTSSAKTNCWAFWPPVSPSSGGKVTKQSGIKGKLGTFRNHGVTQLTLNGQPLYYFTPDIKAHNKHQALGDQLKTFGSIWHIVKASGSHSTSGSGTGSGTGTGTMPTTTTNPYPGTY